MITIEGMLTVSEAAKRLHRSEEQVRRNLRQGKLRGQRIGNQWFVEETAVPPQKERKPLIPFEVQARARNNRDSIYKRTGIVFDVVADLRRLREGRR